MNEKLKPCPFDGKKSKVFKGLYGWEVGCPQCGISCKSEFHTRDGAIRHWNRRAK